MGEITLLDGSIGQEIVKRSEERATPLWSTSVMINCSRPEGIEEGLEIIKSFGKPFGAYANRFTRISQAFLQDAPTVDALEHRKDLGPEAYADRAMSWVAQGAAIVGGCCEAGPDDIAELARRLRAAGHQIV